MPDTVTIDAYEARAIMRELDSNKEALKHLAPKAEAYDAMIALLTMTVGIGNAKGIGFAAAENALWPLQRQLARLDAKQEPDPVPAAAEAPKPKRKYTRRKAAPELRFLSRKKAPAKKVLTRRGRPPKS